MVLIIVVDRWFNNFVIIFYYYNTSSLVSIICLFSVWSETIIGGNKSELGKERELANSSVEPRPTFASKVNLV